MNNSIYYSRCLVYKMFLLAFRILKKLQRYTSMSHRLILIFLVFIFAYGCQSTDDKAVEATKKLMVNYAIGYDTLAIPRLELSYQNNLKNMALPDTLNRQASFFQAYQKDLAKIDPAYLPDDLLRDYELLVFEISLHLERIQLQRNHQTNHQDRPISEKGIYFIPNGKAWYRYYLKRWLMADVTPEKMIDFGIKEIQSVQRDVQKLQRDLGFRNDTLAFYDHLNEPLFKEKSKRKIQRLFEARQEIVQKNLAACFENTDIGLPNIERGDNPELSQVPAYYRSSTETFYYNIFDQPFNKRLTDLLYLHEAIPGHHYQIQIEKLYKDSIPAFYQYLPQSVYQEGWAAYVEELGEEMGLYRTLYDLMGKHEWNLVRSVRVVLDIGLNYQGWSDEKALTFWKKNINNQEDIAMREINRMRRWPVQVITYKYGAARILEKRREAKLKGGFSLKNFHQEILSRGAVF